MRWKQPNLTYECNLLQRPPDKQDEESNGLYFDIEGGICFVSPIDTPIPGNELEFAMKISHLWLDAQESVSHSNAHLFVCDAPFKLEISALDQHLILTKLVESVLYTFPIALGVYQGMPL